MALTEESRQLMAMLAKSERDRRRANLAGDLYQASMIASGVSPLEAQMKAAQLRQQEEGLDEETRWERSQALMKPLGAISEKKIAEYGKLLKDTGDAQRKALEKYLDVVARSQSSAGPAAAVRQMGSVMLQELKQMDKMIKDSETASKETNTIARNIIKAASGETGEGRDRGPEEFGEVVAEKLDDILYRDAVAKSRNQPGALSAGQRKHLVAALRPAMGQSVQRKLKIGDDEVTRDALYQEYLAKDAGQDLEEIKQRRQLLIRDAPKRLSRFTGVAGSSRALRTAEAALAKASDNYQNAIVKFRNEVPPETLFGSTVYEKMALPQLKAIQEAPSKALPSVHLGRKLMEREDVKEITGGDPSKLMDLMKSFQKSQVRAKRLPFFPKKKEKRPAPPSAVYGSERQVSLEETEVPDGGTGVPGPVA